MVWLEESRRRCSGCGTWAWEWEENPEAWFADHIYCPGCKRRGEHHQWVTDRSSMTHHAGLQIGLYRTPREFGEEEELDGL